jgi:hypothetical protein
VDETASCLCPHDSSRAGHKIVAEGVATSELAFGIFQDVRDRREACVRMRREGPTGHSEFVTVGPQAEEADVE